MAQFAYLIFSPDPTYFQPIQTRNGQFPSVQVPQNAPIPVGGNPPSTYLVKFGDQSSSNGALKDYKRCNPSCESLFVSPYFPAYDKCNRVVNFNPIQINGIPFPGWNNIGKFLEDRVLGTVANRHQGAQPFKHVDLGEEWYYSWNRGQLLQNLVTLVATATRTANALALNINDANRQQANNQAQDALDGPVRQILQGYQLNQWPPWTNFTSGRAGFANQELQRNQALRQGINQRIQQQQRLVWVEVPGVLNFFNELVAVVFFDQYLFTD